MMLPAPSLEATFVFTVTLLSCCISYVAAAPSLLYTNITADPMTAAAYTTTRINFIYGSDGTSSSGKLYNPTPRKPDCFGR
jgi:hypothetical protein